jgi:glycosyltransferase involved in cell wall biosynthesis
VIGPPARYSARPVQSPRILINALSVTQGGGRSYIRNLLRELERDSRGFDFTVIGAADQLTAEDTGAIEAVRVALPRSVRLPYRIFYEVAILPLRALAFDLLYCVADISPFVSYTPTVVALRNLNIYDHRFYDDARIHMLERLVRLGNRRARRIVFPTRAAAEQVARVVPVPEGRAVVIPHGISPEAFAVPSPPRGSAEVPYLFLAASLEWHKNVPVLVESLRYVSDPRLEVWIAGSEEIDPPCAADVRRVVDRLGLRARVRFLGPVSYREILGYYRGAVAFVFPSFLESFGHPLLEAMLAETPIVAADIPSFHEVAGEAALYFPPQDPVALARTVDLLRSEPAATRARVERGRALAQGYSWQRSVDRLCEVFREVLLDSGGSS